MARHHSRSRSRSRSPYDEPRDSRHERRSPAPSGLLVRNISLSSRPEDLRVSFEKFGPIKDIYLPKNYYTGEPRGFGFVKFRYPEDAADAKSHLDRTDIGGREIRIAFAEENRKSPHEMRRVRRRSSRGSYRRRSRSPSHRRRYRSHSRSPSPARHALRDGRREATRGDRYSTRKSRSVSRSVSPRDDDRKFRSRERSRRHSRSLSHSASPCDKKNHKNHQSPTSKENGQARHADAPSGFRSRSPRKKSRSPQRSCSQSCSPR